MKVIVTVALDSGTNTQHVYEMGTCLEAVALFDAIVATLPKTDWSKMTSVVRRERVGSDELRKTLDHVKFGETPRSLKLQVYLDGNLVRYAREACASEGWVDIDGKRHYGNVEIFQED